MRPVVLIYDRSVTPGTTALLSRLRECERHALRQGWLPVGTWVDSGERALVADFRPQLDVALARVPRLRRCADGCEREVVVLVHSNDRFSNDALWASSLRYRVAQSGARLELLVENTDEHTCTPVAEPSDTLEALRAKVRELNAHCAKWRPLR